MTATAKTRTKPRAKQEAAPGGPAIEFRPLDSLIPYARNARTHSAEQVAQLAASLIEFGFTNPVLADATGIVAGHGRVLAARQLYDAGKTLRLPGGQPVPAGAIPVLDCTGWTEAQRRAYILVDNKLALNAGWDYDMLGTELSELLEQFDASLLGFSAEELDKIIHGFSSSGLTDPDYSPEPPIDPVTALGDVWVLGHHRLVCGDCTDATVVATVLGSVKPHLMVTDPPYGVEYDPSWRARAGVNLNRKKLGVVKNDDRSDWREAWALFPGDVAYVWHASLFTREVLESLQACGFKHRAMIIWAKDRFTLGRGDYHWQHEPAWYVVRNGAKGSWNGDRSQSTLWNIKAREDGGHGHSTQKPVECMRRPIENNSSPGQAIYEPFCGSGTTIIAGEMTGRCVHAIELSPVYVDVAVKRWQEFTGQQATLESTGQTFSEVAEHRQPVAVES